MRTVRSSGRRGGCLSREGGVSAQEVGGVWPEGGVCLPRGVSARQGSVPMHAGIHLPSCQQNDWQTGVKTLPFRNFICGRQWEFYYKTETNTCTELSKSHCSP